MSDLKITYPEELPVSGHRDEILAAITNHQVVVIAGATGSGKTTQLPKMCLELGRKSIAHTQPRRIAARSVAERIAEELKVTLGEEVGYQVRFTDKANKNTLVKVMTDGILLNAMQHDRLLSHYDTVIIDEAHERSLNIDFLLGYLKQLLPQRPELKVIITSATIDPESFSKHFDGAPIIEVSGRTYPIEIRYRPVVREKSHPSDPDEETTASDYIDGIIAALSELGGEPDGDVLVFLSGESEIKDAQDVIQGAVTSGLLGRGIEVLPLYGRLSSAEQHRVFEPSQMAGIRRRIILGTNVAETSLTIPNIKYVIDSGTARISRYSPRAKVQRLPIEAISQASANQRAGRAGRTSPGVVVRLYSEEDYKSRPEFTDPEILRTNLASVILQAATLGLGQISKFPFLQSPDSRGVKDGINLLTELGAVESTDGGEVKLTKLGKQLARLPIEPRFARMLLESQKHGITREVMIIVAGLTIQDPRERPTEKREKADQLHSRFLDQTSDFLGLVNLWNHIEDQQEKLSGSAFRRLCKAEYLNYLRVREWQDLMRQLQQIIKPLNLVIGPRRVNPTGIHKAILAGLLSQIGIKQPNETVYTPKGVKPAKGPSQYLGSGGKKFYIFPGSALNKKQPEALMSAELVETSRLFARMNAAIDPAWAEELAGDNCKRQFSEPHWEKKQGAVIAFESVTLFGLPIITRRKIQYSRIDPFFSRELFIRHALVAGEWDSKQTFEPKNKAFLQELETQADRLRDPRLLPDEERIFTFFNNRIPLDVFSTRTFEGWWRKVKNEKPELLIFTKEKLFEDVPDQVDDHRYPEHLFIDNQVFDLSYKFAPGEIDDGLTVDIPIEALAGLKPVGFDWLVEGMRQELITELIRSLPKAIRKNVVPAADWATKVLNELPKEPVGNIYQLTAELLQKLSGQRVSGADFDLAKLPPSLRMTYRVIGNKGKPVAIDIDLRKLQLELARPTEIAVAKAATKLHSSLERQDLKTWDLGDLQLVIESEHSGKTIKAYPALALSGIRVDLRVFATERDQQLNHHRALTELVKLQIPNSAKYVSSHLKQEEKLAIAALGYPSVASFVDDLTTALTNKVIAQTKPQGLVSSLKEFETIRDSVNAEVLEQAFAAAAQIERAAKNLREATKAISNAKAIDFLNELSEEKQHISLLSGDKLISQITLDRLPRLATYFAATKMRVEKLQENPAKDRLGSAELAQAIEAFEKAGGVIPLPWDADKRLLDARWLIEELRVSLFAQPLGTSETVSVQRIKKLLAS